MSVTEEARGQQGAPGEPPLAARGMARSPAGGVRIAWRAYGPAEGDPIFLIMGYMGSGRAWWRLLPHLVGAGRRAVVVDNRGTGDSAKPGGRWTMADMTADAVAVFDDAGVERADVLGASMGGMIAQHLALDHPPRVRSLTLACTAAVGRNGAPPWRMVAGLLARPLMPAKRSFPIVAPLLYSERSRREQPERMAQDLAVRIRDATPFATSIGQGAALDGHDTRGRLRELELPALVVHGEDDALVSPERGRDLAARIPGAQLVTLPQTGHILMTDSEEATAAALLGFLSEAVGSGA